MKITDMVKTATACFRDMLFEIEVFIKRYSIFKTEAAGMIL